MRSDGTLILRCGALRIAPLLLVALAACESGQVRITHPPAFQAALRPDDAASTDMFRFASTDVVETHASPSGDFLIHFTRDGPNKVPSADVDGNGVPDFVEKVGLVYDEVLGFYRDELGFDAPLNDATVSSNGGDARFDVYLLDFGGSADGAFRTDRCSSDGTCVGYMVQENDFAGYGYSSSTEAIRILASHEFFHAVQAAYDNEQGSVLGEGTAVWATEAFDPTLDDFEHFADGYLDNPDRSLDKPLPGPVDPFSYGSGIFFYFLAERYAPSLIRVLWENCRADDSASTGPTWLSLLPAVLAAEAQTSFADAFTEFAIWNLHTSYFADSSVAYPNAAELPPVKMTEVTAPHVDEALRVFYASSQYFAFTLDGRTELGAALVGAPDTLQDLRLVVATRHDGEILEVVDADDVTAAPVLDTSGASSAVVIVVNTTTSGESKKPGLCIGTPAELAACRAALAPPANDTAPPREDEGGCAAGSAAGPAWMLVGALLLLARRASTRRR